MADLEQQSMEPKSLYMIIRPDETPNPNRFTLYKITNVNLSHDEPKQPPRATAILQFPCHTFCPGMGFVALGSKLYCIGGLDHSAKVYGVDLNTIETCYKENRSPFVRVADMHKGKRFPYVFAWNGKIYAMNFYSYAREDDEEESNNFEVFDPETGEWSVLPRHNYITIYRPDSDTYISGHAIVCDTVFLGSLRHCYRDISSFDLKNNNWVHEHKRCSKNYPPSKDEILGNYMSAWRKTLIKEYPKEEEVIGDYMSAWRKTLMEEAFPASAITVNNTLYAYNCGYIATYHISNNEDDRYIPCEKVRGIEFDYVHGVIHAELVHFGDEKFCLAMIRRPRRDYNDDNSKYEFALLTFEVVKQKSSKADDQLLCWADIYDFRAVETSDDALLSWTKFVYCFAA